MFVIITINIIMTITTTIITYFMNILKIIVMALHYDNVCFPRSRSSLDNSGPGARIPRRPTTQELPMVGHWLGDMNIYLHVSTYWY